MKNLMRRCAIMLFGCLFSSVSWAASPDYKVKIQLKFEGNPDCYIKESGKKGTKDQAKGMVKHDEDTISWSASCVVKMPKGVSYCAMVSQSVKNPGDFVYYSTEVKKGAITAKIISDADINPEFAEFTASYLCFK